MREWFLLYLNSDLEEWAKQSEILESGIKLTMGFEESNFSLIPKAILHVTREERWFWKSSHQYTHSVSTGRYLQTWNGSEPEDL